MTILGTNHPVVITSGPESASVSELADTTGSAAIDTTTTVPAGTLNFTDAGHRRHPHRRGDARLRNGSGGGRSGRDAGRSRDRAHHHAA